MTQVETARRFLALYLKAGRLAEPALARLRREAIVRAVHQAQCWREFQGLRSGLVGSRHNGGTDGN
jgi:hypothetical protein